jgi:ligand-binding SRPBCC domain-containing protein
MHTYTLEREQTIPRSRSETFGFFCDAFNLQQLTPAFVNLQVLTTRPITMSAGVLLDYQLSLFGVPIKWRTLVTEWSPVDGFVDEEIRGPFAMWRHTHKFEELAPDLTLMRDHVLYQLPFGLIGRLAHLVFVRPALKKIFDYRSKAISELFL